MPDARARKLTIHDVAGSGAVVRGAELVIAIERLNHGYGRLRILKDRDGDLPVGEAWPLIFNRGDGFRLDHKEEQTAEQLEHGILDDPGVAWRTVKEWAIHLGIRETRAREILERLHESAAVEHLVGPPGRSPRASCYRSAPTAREQSGAVTPSLLDDATAPTAPTSIEDVGSGSSTGSAPTAREQSGAVDAAEISRLEELARAMSAEGYFEGDFGGDS